MVKFDASMLRFLSRDDFRVLSAIELGMKKNDYVPVELITQLAGIRSGIRNSLSLLHKYNLIKRINIAYEGFKLTYAGYDYLALNALVSKGLIKAIGHRIGVGKESDIFEVINDNDEQMILKIHRLGRICFRTVRTKREYTRSTTKLSFMYLSRLAAIREFAYMKALYDEGFPTPIPYEVNRHCILMSRAKAYPMAGVTSVRNPQKVYNQLMNLIVQFAQCGLIHGDFNEFNLLINDKDDITVIDFPQMISTSHRDAKEQFERDVNCIRRFFSKKLGYDFEDYPKFIADTGKEIDLDVALKAAGAHASRAEMRDMDTVLDAQDDLRGLDSDEDDEDYEDDDDDDVEEEEEEEEEEEKATRRKFYDNDDDVDEDEDEDGEEDGAQMRERRQRNMEQRSRTNVNQRRHENRFNEEFEDNEEDDDDEMPSLMMLTDEHLANLNLLSDDDNEEDNEEAKVRTRKPRKTEHKLTNAEVKIRVKKTAMKKTQPRIKYSSNKSKDKTKISLRSEAKNYL